MVHAERGGDKDRSLERKRKASKEWYVANREKLNAARRQKYRTDEKYRGIAKRRAREYKRAHPKNEGSVRIVNGERIRMYRIGEVARRLNCSVRTIRRWEEKGIIPYPSLPNCAHRVYKLHQIGLMLRLIRLRPSERPAKAAEIRREW